jgi:hypothetical protein
MSFTILIIIHTKVNDRSGKDCGMGVLGMFFEKFLYFMIKVYLHGSPLPLRSAHNRSPPDFLRRSRYDKYAAVWTLKIPAFHTGALVTHAS